MAAKGRFTNPENARSLAAVPANGLENRVHVVAPNVRQ
jgi:hypothetical protein